MLVSAMTQKNIKSIAKYTRQTNVKIILKNLSQTRTSREERQEKHQYFLKSRVQTYACQCHHSEINKTHS